MSELVNVPVPVERLQEVYALLARDPSRPSTSHEVLQDGYPAGWSKALVDRMFIESSSAMRRILVAIAQTSPKWVATGEIAAACGLTPRQVIASLGPFEKRVRGRYAMSHWPFAARQFVDAGILKYSMSPEVAAHVLELAAHAEGAGEVD
ncbi:MAG: hypothetical protein JXP72_08215 [Coriobacteriia bacterium]|nr:hypothetical protein [Coriobacteriia bacterium]